MKKSIFNFKKVPVELFLTIVMSVMLLSSSSSDKLDKCRELMIELQKSNVKHPKVVLAQAILETGWFKSYSYINRRNLFGLFNSSKGDYFKFPSEKECILAYKRMIQDKYYTDTSKSYYEFLECMWEYKGECKRYAQAKDYNQKLISIVKWIDKNEEIWKLKQL